MVNLAVIRRLIKFRVGASQSRNRLKLYQHLEHINPLDAPAESIVAQRRPCPRRRRLSKSDRLLVRSRRLRADLAPFTSGR